MVSAIGVDDSSSALVAQEREIAGWPASQVVRWTDCLSLLCNRRAILVSLQCLAEMEASDDHKLL